MSFGDLDNFPAMIGRALVNPMFHGVSVSATCGRWRTEDPRVARCSTALAHCNEVTRDSSHPDHILLETWRDDFTLSRCVARPWPDSHLACLMAAADASAITRCEEQLGEDPIEFHSQPVCGTRGTRIRIGIPLLEIESLKLAEIALHEPRTDCFDTSGGQPGRVEVGPGKSELTGETIALAVFGYDDTYRRPAIDLTAPYPGHNDSRWHDDVYLTDERCPHTRRVFPIFGLHSYSNTTSCGAASVKIELQPKAAQLCRGDDASTCTTVALPPLQPQQALEVPHAVTELAFDMEARHAALAIGAPGAQSIEVWDLIAKRRISRLAVSITRDRPCAHVEVLGKTLLVASGMCGDLSVHPADAFLATLDGKRIAAVGGDHPLATLFSPVWLSGSRWAFVASRGERVVIQDVATGAIVRQIATGDQVEPGKLTAGGDTAGHVALVFGGETPLAGGVTSIDTTTGSVLHIAPRTRCPATSDDEP